jgi:alanyl-tRNA synthetase
MTSREIRKTFLEFFAERDHRVVPSSPLVLPNDPTLLFANAGMNQFKDVFTGRERRDYTRAASSQKCLRISGKHNDLEMVGRTPRHHTFFEMLGNFSFGDYFKREAIAWGWELLTEVYGLPADRLWVSVFGGSEAAPADEEAFAIWKDEVGVPPERILRLDEKENFWRMGDTGPCGPSSELHYDLGDDLTSVEGESTPANDERRFIEVWNLVFMQFEQRDDGRVPLPKPSIDTGMGLERITAVLQGVRSNYETDLFLPILEAAAHRAGCRVGDDDDKDFSLRVIADHSRALCFLVADGVVPANDKRGYGLRRVIRRAIRHGRRLGVEGPFLQDVTPTVIDGLGDVYPEIVAAREAILEVGRREEERFADTLSTGLQLLDEAFNEAGGEGGETVLPGTELFRLYDTFGLPLDLARDIAEERGVTLDEEGFEAEMAKQRARAQASWKGGRREEVAEVYRDLAEKSRTVFEGYTTTETEDVPIVAVLRDGRSVDALEEGEGGEVILELTPFYGESGGQVGDTGYLVGTSGRARVLDTQRPAEGIISHTVMVETGRLPADDRVSAEVDVARRDAIRRNHTATHLLHAALRDVLGTHVKQAGSLVAPDRLRFDFSHFAPLSDRAVADIETLANRRILDDIDLREDRMALDEALRNGAMALFGEKYGDEVRVISIGDFSKELCGGTHCGRTGEIGLLKLTQERGIASGTRRIEAVTGEGSLERFREEHGVVRTLEEMLSVPRAEVVAEFERRLDQVRALQKELEAQRLGSMRQDLDLKAADPTLAGGIKVLTHRVDGLKKQETRVLADNMRNKLGSGVVIFGRAEGDKASILVAVTKDLEDRIPAGEVVRELAGIIGGRGGGRKDLAEAGGREPSRLDEALGTGVELVARRVGGDA